MHLVYKGVGTSCGTTRSLPHMWIDPCLNKGTSGIPTARQIFFHVPKSCVNLSGLEMLQKKMHSLQGLSQYSMKMEELSTPLEGCPEGRPVTSIWYLVASLLAVWAPSQKWPNVSGTPDTVEKALQMAGETLEESTSWGVTTGTTGWVFLSAL